MAAGEMQMTNATLLARVAASGPIHPPWLTPLMPTGIVYLSLRRRTPAIPSSANSSMLALL